MRMLDNVIDINFYTVPEARASTLRHRPVGLGIMGYQDALYRMRIPFTSPAAVRFADESMERISYEAISASVDLAEERGRYPSFGGSLWSQGILPIDSVEILQANRDHQLTVDRSSTLNWETLRTRVKTSGMRNSNTPRHRPHGHHLEHLWRYPVDRAHLPEPLRQIQHERRLHRRQCLPRQGPEGRQPLGRGHDLRPKVPSNGSLGSIDRVPEELKRLYATSFEIEPTWLIQAAACRQKWIDQAQSLNLYIDQPSGRKLDTLYREAWHAGLKTTYYLRSRSATHVEKSTVKRTDGKLNAVAVSTPTVCDLTDPHLRGLPVGREGNPMLTWTEEATQEEIGDPRSPPNSGRSGNHHRPHRNPRPR